MKLLAAILGAILISFNSFSQSGCTDPTACNYDMSAISDDGSCELEGWHSFGDASLLSDIHPWGLDQIIEMSKLTNEIYCAYKGTDFLPHVIRYSDCQWEFVGNQNFTSDYVVYYVKLAIDPVNGKPIIAYTESNSHFLRVKIYDGGEWKDLGGSDFYPNSHLQLWNLRLHPLTNEPYLLFKDNNGEGPIGYTVLKYSNETWTTVGPPSFTVDDVGSWVDMNINPISGEPYIAYHEPDPFQLTIKKFNGSNWELVGPSRITPGTADWVKIDFDPTDGQPIVVYKDLNNNDEITARKFDGINWNQLGSTVPSEFLYWLQLSIDPNSGLPRFSYRGNQPFPILQTTAIYDFNGVDWELNEIVPSAVGMQGFQHTYHSETGELLIGGIPAGILTVYQKGCGVICDSDSDGISDEDEFAAGTNPYNSDSDGDGLTDAMEIEVSLTDPSNPDSDGDGCNDYLEWGHLCPDSIPCEEDNCPGDLNGDDIVNVGDLAIMLSAFGITCVD